MYHPTIIDESFAGIQSWHERGGAPAYLRGIPSWAWKTALRRPRSRRPPVQIS